MTEQVEAKRLTGGNSFATQTTPPLAFSISRLEPITSGCL